MVLLTIFETNYDCEILDLSFCGARLLLDTKLPIGSQVALTHSHCGDVFGIVKWNSPSEVGLELSPGVSRLLTRCGHSDVNPAPAH